MTQLAFDFDGPGPTGFQMQSHHAGTWTPMEDGVAPKVWKPRKAAAEAVHKCIEWTGTICIPAMRVIDLSDGTIVWQDTAQYPDAGPRIIPAWAEPIYEQVRAENRAEAEADRDLYRDLAPADETLD